MNLVYGQDATVTQWVIDRIPHVSDFGPCAAIGVASDHLVAGVVYHDYQPACESVQISMAASSPMWARREIIGQLLAYPFIQLGCWSVFTLTPDDNVKAIKVNRHIGLNKEAVLPHAFGKHRHSVFCQMLRPKYFELYGENHGQELRICASAA